jgi:hypothetical protein
MKLTKTKADQEKEERDLQNDSALVFLANLEAFKFKVGDILLLMLYSPEEDEGDEPKITWEIEKDNIGAPIKYVYAFENKLGVGYIKKLDNSGKGPTKAQPICVTKIAEQGSRLVLDPDYAEHLLINGEEEFEYNARHKAYKIFRDEALKKNETIAIQTTEGDPLYDFDAGALTKQYKQFWKTLKVGDTVYADDDGSNTDIAIFGHMTYEVTAITKNRSSITFKVIKDIGGYNDFGDEFKFGRDKMAQNHSYVGTQRPYPLTEDNI